MQIHGGTPSFRFSQSTVRFGFVGADPRPYDSYGDTVSERFPYVSKNVYDLYSSGERFVRLSPT
jgi:hypothetical protein